MKFENFNINETILKAIEEEGFQQCTEVQEKSLPLTLERKDVLVQSQTGTGKTAAFTIPLLENYVRNKAKTLVLAPTRELALQIKTEVEKLGRHTGIKSGCFFGGGSYNTQNKLAEQGVDAVIATPGRLIDFVKSGKIQLKDFEVLVLDEADRMLDMGFLQDIRWIIKKMLPADKRHTMLFSATLNTKARHLAWEYMNNPEEIEIAPEEIVMDKIDQSLFHVSSSEKMQLLLGILKRENPQAALIFTNTKKDAEIVSKRLNLNGYETKFIIGDLPQKKRSAIIEKIKSGEIKFLVATDVAARGIHIDDLDMVINYDVPEDYENYVHRIGRTARAGKKGKAVTFACEKYVYGLEAIEEYIGTKIPSTYPIEEDLVEDKSKGQWIETTDNRSNKSGNRQNNRPGNRQGNRQGNRNDNRGGRNNNQGNNNRNAGNRNKQGQNNKGPQRNNNRNQQPKSLPKNATQEERLAFYEAKYGENFGAKQGNRSQGNKQQNRNRQNNQNRPNNNRNRNQQNRNKQQSNNAANQNRKQTPANNNRKKTVSEPVQKKGLNSKKFSLRNIFRKKR
jgi:ATP-dependent RNA helicase RhlB